MVTSNGSFDPIASYARLSERVENQGRDIVDLRSNMNTGFNNLQSSIKHLGDALAAGGRTQWPLIWSAIGVSFGVLSVIGGFVLAGVNKETDRLDRATLELRANAVSIASFLEFKSTYENNRVVSRTEYNDKFANLGEDVREVRSQLVPRSEIERMSDLYNQRFADQQRQLEQIQASMGGMYGQRDLNQELLNRLRRIEGTAP